MASTSSNIVFNDLFTISNIDPEGKKYERVSRLYAHSNNYDMDLTLDYNTEVYPLQNHESFTLVLASTLARDGDVAATNGVNGEEEKDTNVWRPDGKGRGGLGEDYEYIMYGRVYKFDGAASDIVTAYISYGGLLMSLTGSYRHMTGIVLNEPVYLLLRR